MAEVITKVVRSLAASSSSATSSSSCPPVDDEALFRAGKVVNGYQWGPTLGQGAFGKVKLCRHVETSQLVAVKVMNKRALAKKRYTNQRPGGRLVVATELERVQEAVAIYRRVDCPRHIVALRCVIDDPDAPKLYLVVDYMARGQIMDWQPELREYAGRPGVFPANAWAKGVREADARRTVRSVLHGLAYLHDELGVCHRDIKPDNILIHADGSARLGDLGTATVMAGEGGGGGRVVGTAGTYYFQSPESCEDDPYRGAAADVWSLGVTTFAMCYGALPYYSADLVGMFDAIADLNRPVDWPATEPAVSDAWHDALQCMLQKRPEERASVRDLLAHAWLADDDDQH